MANRLRMSAELGDWLAELCTDEPVSAAEVGAAVVAVMAAADPTTLALVGTPAIDPIDPREELDYLYQGMLEALQDVRLEVANTATRRVGAERLLAELDSDPEADPAVQAWLRQARDKAKRQEAEVTKRTQPLRGEVDRFRTAKETAKAMYTTAEASLRIHDAVETATSEGVVDSQKITEDQPPQSASAGDDEHAQLNRALEAAKAQLQSVADEAYQTIRNLQLSTPGGQHGSRTGLGAQVPAQPIAGLLELRADPLGRDVRLLMALEPADTLTLLAVLDGEDAITEHQVQAIRLAGDLLTDIRAGDWPPAKADDPADVEVIFADSATFLARFFPAQASAMAARAVGLATARPLAELRGSTSLADLSNNTGISEQRLREIDEGGLRVAEVHEAVAYVRGLGGRLTLTAELPDSDPAQLT